MNIIPFIAAQVTLRVIYLLQSETGHNADSDVCPVILATKKLHSLYSDLLICCDVCLCPYTNHGHCGMFTENVFNITC